MATTLKLNEMLAFMIALAATSHKDQFDKAGVPYIMHVLTVMQLLNSSDVELNCIAVGHDLFEDTKVTAQQLRDAGISERVISGILALTKQRGESYEEYKAKVFANPDAMLVKCADLTHNSDIRRLKGVSEKDIDRATKYQHFYYEIQQRLKSAESVKV